MPAEVTPHEWRRLASPVGAVWLALLVAAADEDWSRHGWQWWVRSAGAAVLGWLAIGLVALCFGRVVERGWVARWPRLGGALTRRRQARWRRYHEAARKAAAAGDSAAADRWARRRNAIAPAEPQCPHGIADRWAALGSRVDAAYGLDAAAVWPRLWLLLPERVRAELRRAEARWHQACVWASWALLFVGLSIGLTAAGHHGLAAIAGGVGLLLVAWAGRRSRLAIGYRAELVEAAFDVYAVRLASALGVPLGSDGQVDQRVGVEITARVAKGV